MSDFWERVDIFLIFLICNPNSVLSTINGGSTFHVQRARMLLGGMGWDEWERRGEAGHSLSVEVCLPDAMWGAMGGWTGQPSRLL